MKVTITRLLETSKYLATEAGAQLTGMIGQLADFMDQGVRALRNGLTFRDNYDCDPRTLSLKNATATVVASTRPVTGILTPRTLSTTHALTSFLWYYDANSKLTVKATFLPVPTGTVDQEVILLF